MVERAQDLDTLRDQGAGERTHSGSVGRRGRKWRCAGVEIDWAEVEQLEQRAEPVVVKLQLGDWRARWPRFAKPVERRRQRRIPDRELSPFLAAPAVAVARAFRRRPQAAHRARIERAARARLGADEQAAAEIAQLHEVALLRQRDDLGLDVIIHCCALRQEAVVEPAATRVAEEDQALPPRRRANLRM
jgi:hypothetical protein